MTATEKAFGLPDRLKLVNDAIGLQSVSRIPICPTVNSLPLFLSNVGASYKDMMYDPQKAIDAIVKFEAELLPDAWHPQKFLSGRMFELSGTRILDWPGRPGTRVPDVSTYQVLEPELMYEDEYDELLSDYTGFMIRKYFPRTYQGLTPLAKLDFNPAALFPTGFDPFLAPEMVEMYKALTEMAEKKAEYDGYFMQLMQKVMGLGVPPMIVGLCFAPYDAFADYIRATEGSMIDLVEQPEMIEKVVRLFTGKIIKGLEYLEQAQLPVRRIMFPLHKGMDGFMSPKHFETLYWQPLMEVCEYLVSIDVTPVLFGEGKYDTRLDAMTGIPKGKVLLHFEQADPVRCKKRFASTACLSGFIPIGDLEYGTPEKIRESTKRYLDVLTDGGGYIFDLAAEVQNGKRENWESMIETVRNWA